MACKEEQVPGLMEPATDPYLVGVAVDVRTAFEETQPGRVHMASFLDICLCVCVRVCLQSESVLYLYLSFCALVRICQGFSLYELPTDIGASFVTMSAWGMHDFAMFRRCDCRQPLQRT